MGAHENLEDGDNVEDENDNSRLRSKTSPPQRDDDHCLCDEMCFKFIPHCFVWRGRAPPGEKEMREGGRGKLGGGVGGTEGQGQ